MHAQSLILRPGGMPVQPIVRRRSSERQRARDDQHANTAIFPRRILGVHFCVVAFFSCCDCSSTLLAPMF